jgi:hypothetical protein
VSDPRAMLRAALSFLALSNRMRRSCVAYTAGSTLGPASVISSPACPPRLRRYDGRGWRALFFSEGFEHSFTSHAGAGWALSPWAAVQQAAHDALAKLEPAPRDWTETNESPA